MHYSIYLLRHLRHSIGRNIHTQRSNQKLTLQKLAQLSGVSEQLLDRYELGKNEIRLDDILKISCALDLEIKEILA